MAKKVMSWRFPLQRTHAGILMGNGVQGLMVWGRDKLHITVGRAGFWDHRGGNVFASKTTFRKLRSLLEGGDEAAIGEIFAPARRDAGQPERPQQVGGGRVELTFPDGLRPVQGDLEVGTATLTIVLTNDAGREEEVVIRQAIGGGSELAWVEVPESLRGNVGIEVVPSWRYVGEELTKVGVTPPGMWRDEKGTGFVQTLPEDPALALAVADRTKTGGEQIVIATALASAGAMETARRQAEMGDVGKASRKARTWWRKYWADVPVLDLPDPVLQRAYDYGVYKQAGMSTPGGVAASLQGPWLEEYQLPPWSADYHLNVNVEMIYWPALSTNRLDHFGPLWQMIMGWMPQLKANAKGFFEVDDALMLPHAVDDRCRAVGQFWTGTIDHGCTAWMAQLAWLHYRYSMDEKVLRDVAWPLLVGAFNGYWAMLEEEEGRKRLSLPVSVSPEYNGSSMQAWGRDASFQLAALHCVASILPRAAEVLGQPMDARWERVSEELPPYTMVERVRGANVMKLIHTDPEWNEAELRREQQYARSKEGSSEEFRPGPRIGMWEGKDLDSSHRHPSHLAGIYPFRTVDPADGAHATVVRNSLYHWIRQGAGAWSGWALPFVASIHARCGHIEGAIAWLHIWDEIFTNEGHGTLHDAFFRGFTVLTSDEREADGNDREIMQMDAGMGAVSAIIELLVQCKGKLGEEIVVLPTVPRRWTDFSFDGIRVEGAFQVGATVRGCVRREVRITSLAGGAITVTHNLGEHWTLDGVPQTGKQARIAMEKGQKAILAAPMAQG